MMKPFAISLSVLAYKFIRKLVIVSKLINQLSKIHTLPSVLPKGTHSFRASHFIEPV